MKKLTLEELISRLKEKKRTLILTHRNPDPDTLGSAFALKCILKALGSPSFVACADKVPKRLEFITGGASLEYTGEEYERIIAVDIASPKQLGELELLAEKTDITIDHHEMNTRFSDYYEDMGAACCEIFVYLADALCLTDKLGEEFFTSVYAGISGDTGCFRYSNTSERTLTYAAGIIKKGLIDFADINRRIFDSHTLGEINAQKLTYEHMKFYSGGTLAIILFTNEMKKSGGVTDEDTGDIVNYIRAIEGVSVAVSLKQSSKDEHKFFVSSRANEDIDVSAVCAKLGGGGHPRAAGATFTADSPEKALETCVSLFSEAVERNGK